MAPCLVAGLRLFDTVYSEIPAEGTLPAQWPIWTAFGATVIGTGLGIYFVSEHRNCATFAGYLCTERKQTVLPATISLAASGGLLALTTYLYVRRDRAIDRARRHPRPLALGFDTMPDGGIVTFSGTFD
jgi:uncharacterized membrane protein YedE/YeeE